MTASIVFAWGALVAAFSGVAPAQGDPETTRYLRVTPKGTATECTFRVQRGEKSWTLESVTERGGSTLTVSARYDASDVLLDAQAASNAGDPRKTVRVDVSEGKADVRREGLEALSFEVPRRVIVTSAPDWSDTFLIARHYDRKKAGKQEFPGLWIHPTQAPQRLTFTAEKVGSTSIEHGTEKVELDRLSIRIRGNSEYAAWVDPAGRLIKLVAMPFKEGSVQLVLEGFEKSASGLVP